MDWHLVTNNTYRFEMIDPEDLRTSRGWLNGYIQDSGGLTWSYYADEKVSGNATFFNPNYIQNSLIRVWHKAYTETDAYEHVLATMFVSDIKPTYEGSDSTVEFSLSSTLMRFYADRMPMDIPINAGDSPLGLFRQTVTDAKGQYSIDSWIVDKPFNNPHIFEYDKPNMEKLQHVARYLDAQVGVDEYGYVTLKHAQSPEEKPVNNTFRIDEEQLLLPEHSASNNLSEMFNRFCVKYVTNDDVSLFAWADVADSHPASFDKRKFRSTNCYTESDMEPETQARAQQLANQYMAQNSLIQQRAMTMRYTDKLDAVNGNVVRIIRTGLDMDGMVRSVDMSLSPEALCEVSFNEVRNRA